MSKRVLLITYYWPPSGGAGVQRVLKTVKYLRDFGWEPVVYTAADAAYPVIDESLAAEVPAGVEVIREPIWEPYELYKRFTGQSKKKRVYSGLMNDDAKPSLAQRASVWIRGNFFVPDARRFWIGPSVRRLRAYLKDHPVDALYSSGPPHSCHLIARNLKRATGLPWLADFRDPWTEIDFYDQLMLTAWADRQHHRQEQTVLREADRVTSVGWTTAQQLGKLGDRAVDVVFNGFDETDFPAEAAAAPDDTFTVCHAGSVNRDRNSPELWAVLGELAATDPVFRAKLRLRFAGKVEENTFRQIEAAGLAENLERIDYVPHSEVTTLLARARVLLLLLNDTPTVKGVLTGKLFEYLAARRPILAIGTPDGDAARVLRETGAGTMCGFGDKAAMRTAIQALFADYLAGKPMGGGYDRQIARFTRRGAAAETATLLDSMINKPTTSGVTA